MSRALLKTIVRDSAGNSIQNARVFVYESGTTTPVTDLYPSAVGGIPQASLLSNAQGEVTGWLATPRNVALKTTDNNSQAVYPTVNPDAPVNDAVASHIANPNGAHAASAISVAPFVGMPAADVQEALKTVGATDPLRRYVNGSGDDANDGLSVGTAYATVQAAIADLGATGGWIELGYNLAGHAPFNINVNKRFVIQFNPGAWVQTPASTVGINVQQEAGDTGAGCLIGNPEVRGGGLGDTIGIQFQNSDRALVGNFRIDGCAIGVRWRAEAALATKSGYWSEGCMLEGGFISGSNWALHFYRDPSCPVALASFAETVINGVGTQDSDIGLKIEADTTIYRSKFMALTHFIGAGQTGAFIEGDVNDAILQLSFEDFDVTGSTGLSVGVAAQNIKRASFFLSFTGFGGGGTKVSTGGTQYVNWHEGVKTKVKGTNPRFAEYEFDGDNFPRVDFAGQFAGGGGMRFGGGVIDLDIGLFRNAAHELGTDGDFSLTTAGRGFRQKEGGAAAKCGFAILVGGVVTIDTTAVTATSRFQHSLQFLAGAAVAQAMRIVNVVPGASFQIQSASGIDTSSVYWQIIEPS